MTPREGLLDPRELLTIDVASELRTLALGSLAGPWQVPTELLRWASARGATGIDVTLGRRAVELVFAGTHVDPRDLRALARVLDERSPLPSRHGALVALEAVPGPNLLGLLALEPGGLELHGGGFVLRWRRGARSSLADATASQGTRLLITAPRLDRDRARADLLAAVPFATSVVRVDGRIAPRGFPRAWAEAALPDPLAGRVALVEGLRSSRLRVTLTGLVAAHLTVPGAPPFDAVVAGDAWLPAGASPAALRAAVQPHVPGIVDAAVGLLLREAGASRLLSEAEEDDLLHGLLAAARQRRRLGEVLRVPLVRAHGPAGSVERLSLLDLGRTAEQRGGAALEALDPERRASDFVLRSCPWFVLDSQSRSLLQELLGVRFVTPARREQASVWRRRRAWLAELPAAWMRAWARLRNRTPLADAACSADERGLLRALAEAAAARQEALELRLGASGGLPFRRRAGLTTALWLPRRARLVRLASRALASDPSLGAAALAALSAAGGPPESSGAQKRPAR